MKTWQFTYEKPCRGSWDKSMWTAVVAVVVVVVVIDVVVVVVIVIVDTFDNGNTSTIVYFCNVLKTLLLSLTITSSVS
jgi:hypothetical protein